jgi:hypothetical protein
VNKPHNGRVRIAVISARQPFILHVRWRNLGFCARWAAWHQVALSRSWRGMAANEQHQRRMRSLTAYRISVGAIKRERSARGVLVIVADQCSRHSIGMTRIFNQASITRRRGIMDIAT